LLALEWRAVLECWSTLALYPALRLAPRGDGHPVLVLPGLATGDASTLLLRSYLSGRGFDAQPWHAGINTGKRHLLARTADRLKRLSDQHGGKVSLLGWSMGGVFAREAAKLHPELVRQVITLGSPFNGHPKMTNAWRLYELTSGNKIDSDTDYLSLAVPPPVPFTSIYSHSDGVVNWRLSVERAGAMAESIAVFASHFGLGLNPTVLYLLAERLAQAEGAWRPYAPQGPGKLLFTPHRTADV
jgi:pimeloyl-ACP methyl ester carboxylesterase